MNEPLTPLVTALGSTLLHFLWQGLVIGGLALIALIALKNARPQARYAVAGAALLACLLAAAITLVALMPRSGAAAHPAGDRAASRMAGLPSPAVLLDKAPAASALAPWLVALWAVGSGSMFLRLGLGLVSIQRLRRHPPAPREWQMRLDDLAARFGLGKVALLVADGLDSPLAAGWWRPIVLMPTELLTRLPIAYIEALLAHELAHIRRHDYVLNLIQVTIEALLFYHPVVWWLSRQMRLERELIADQLAARVIAEPRPLVFALAALADLQALVAARLAQAGSGGSLKKRIELLLRPQARARRPASFALTLLGLATSALGLWACTQAIADAPAPAPASIVAAGKPRLSFALVRGDQEHILAWGPDDEIDQVARELPRRTDDFVLVRRNGRDSLVIDAAIVAPLRREWEEAEALEAEATRLHESLLQKHALIQRLVEKIDSASAEAATFADREQESRELSRLESSSAHFYREQNLAYKRVERRLHDSIAAAPSVAL